LAGLRHAPLAAHCKNYTDYQLVRKRHVPQFHFAARESLPGPLPTIAFILTCAHLAASDMQAPARGGPPVSWLVHSITSSAMASTPGGMVRIERCRQRTLCQLGLKPIESLAALLSAPTESGALARGSSPRFEGFRPGQRASARSRGSAGEQEYHRARASERSCQSGLRCVSQTLTVETA
jgi:hypothetical protein